MIPLRIGTEKYIAASAKRRLVLVANLGLRQTRALLLTARRGVRRERFFQVRQKVAQRVPDVGAGRALGPFRIARFDGRENGLVFAIGFGETAGDLRGQPLKPRD